jgi:hypothetical protein
MIAAALLVAALQAAPFAEPPVVRFNRALTFADLGLTVARQRICARPARERRMNAMNARLLELVARARPAFGDVGTPLRIVEGERGGPDCALFGRSLRAADRRLDEAEAILGAATRELH